MKPYYNEALERVIERAKNYVSDGVRSNYIENEKDCVTLRSVLHPCYAISHVEDAIADKNINSGNAGIKSLAVLKNIAQVHLAQCRVSTPTEKNKRALMEVKRWAEFQSGYIIDKSVLDTIEIALSMAVGWLPIWTAPTEENSKILARGYKTDGSVYIETCELLFTDSDPIWSVELFPCNCKPLEWMAIDTTFDEVERK